MPLPKDVQKELRQVLNDLGCSASQIKRELSQYTLEGAQNRIRDARALIASTPVKPHHKRQPKPFTPSQQSNAESLARSSKREAAIYYDSCIDYNWSSPTRQKGLQEPKPIRLKKTAHKVVIADDAWEKLQQIAKDEECSTSLLIRNAIDRYLSEIL